MFSKKILSESCLEIRVPYDAYGETYLFLLTSDHHFDSKKCDRKKLKAHHEAAKEKGAGIFCFGDLFDVMQGRSDRRGSKSDIRSEYLGGNYYDRVVNDAINFYEDYAQNYLMITPGNHETSILKYQETDVIKRLVNGLNASKNTDIHVGTYSGWVKLVFYKTSDRGHVKTFTLFYHHGYGGGGPVTKGVIQTNRKSVYLPDANLIVSGHIHESWHVPVIQERLKSNGVPHLVKQHHISTPGYKEEYLSHEGWHIERGGPPKPTGAYWLEITVGKNLKVKLIEAD